MQKNRCLVISGWRQVLFWCRTVNVD